MPNPTALQLPTLRQLEYVVAVADESSFGEAARRCAVSQPGLSTQVQEVERLVGARLFERDRRGVLLTAAGEEFVAHARAVLLSAREMVEATRGRSRPLVGRLRLGVIPTVAPFFLPTALPRVRAAHAELRLVLREEKTAVLVDLLERGRLDAALLATDVPLGDCDAEDLFFDPFLLAMPPGHPLGRRRRVAEADLDGERVLLLEDGHCLREQALSVCSRAGADEQADLRATSLATLLAMVDGGEGVTLVPAMAEPSVRATMPGIVVRPFASPSPGRRIGLAWRRGSSRAGEMRLLGRSLLPAEPSRPSTR